MQPSSIYIYYFFFFWFRQTVLWFLRITFWNMYSYMPTYRKKHLYRHVSILLLSFFLAFTQKIYKMIITSIHLSFYLLIYLCLYVWISSFTLRYSFYAILIIVSNSIQFQFNHASFLFFIRSFIVFKNNHPGKNKKKEKKKKWIRLPSIVFFFWVTKGRFSTPKSKDFQRRLTQLMPNNWYE